ncbi:armadillo repeat-containing protein 1-like isoform X2 [Mixophyes fleayi]|uniref:armadillo repeat-containing protein 1-like isoform X2 n=1 Tax=Mixophyes fleayi TaxID=3061075 RepID=UPI003F4DAFA0
MDALSVVAHLRILASNPQNRTSIVREKSCLAGLILFLSHQDTSVVECALQTIRYLCENPNHREIMKRELGMMVSLENIRKRCDARTHIKLLAQTIYVLLSAPIQLHTSETKSIINKPQFFISSSNKRAKTIMLHIHGLDDLERKSLCEEVLLKVKGVISFTFQIARRRCTVRVKPDLATEVYLPLQNMEAYPIVEKNLCLPDYFPEDESPQKGLEKAVTRPVSKDENSGSWFNTAANFLSKTFYW